ncbi:MAG: putative ABC transporter permease [Eubacterium sp.]|jgi:uncharacterized membrane protein
MIAGMSYYNICWYFFIYSFLGWVIEVAYHAVTQGKVVNRGFLNGPICPIYGTGILAVFAMSHLIKMDASEHGDVNALVLFVIGTVFATLIELIGGFVLDKCFHARWWDYSNKPFNFHGYICLEFSLIWGLLIVFVVKVIQPYFSGDNINFIPPKYGWWIILAFAILFFADLIVTIAMISGLNKKLSRLNEINASMRKVSDALSKGIAERTIVTAQKVGETRVQAALGAADAKDAVEEAAEDIRIGAVEKKAQTMEKIGAAASEAAGIYEKQRAEYEKKLGELKRSYESIEAEITSGRTFFVSRILKAFPDFKSRYGEDLADRLREKLNLKK